MLKHHFLIIVLHFIVIYVLKVIYIYPLHMYGETIRSDMLLGISSQHHI